MSDQAPQWYINKFKGGVRQVYQREGFSLRDCTTRGSTSSATDVTFFIADGAAKAHKVKQSGQPDQVVPMNNGRRKLTIPFEFFQAAEYIKFVHYLQMEESEQQQAQHDVAMALGREHDDFIMAKIAATDFSGANRSFGANNAAWSLEKALQMCAAAQRQTHGLWDGKWCCPVPAVVWNIMMTYDEFNSADWVDDKSFTKATKAKQWNGVNWWLASDDLFPANGSGKEFFLWHPSAIVSEDNIGTGGDYKMWISWENPLTSTLVNSMMGVACGVREAEGFVRGIAKNDIADISIAA